MQSTADSVAISLDVTTQDNMETEKRSYWPHRSHYSFTIQDFARQPLRNSPGNLSPVDTRKDPFSLSSFFPSCLTGFESEEDQEWGWLQSLDAEVNEEEKRTGPGTRPSPAVRYGRSGQVRSPLEGKTVLTDVEEEEALDIIRHEDKLGILTLGEHLQPPQVSVIIMENLLSPFTKDGPKDDEDLFISLSELRKAYAMSPIHERDMMPPTGRDFPSTRVQDEILETYVRQDGSLVYRGMRRILDFLDLRL